MRSTARSGQLAAFLTLLCTVTSAPVTAQNLLIHGGTVVTSEGRFAANVLVRNGIIVELGRALTASSGVRRIDANSSRSSATAPASFVFSHASTARTAARPLARAHAALPWRAWN